MVNSGEEKSNTEANALWFEDLNCACLPNATEVMAVDSHTPHDGLMLFTALIQHSLSSLNLFKSWQFVLYYSTLLVLIVRLKSFLHEINWNFKKTQQGLLFSKQLRFSLLRLTNKLQTQSNAEDQTFLHPHPEAFRWVRSQPGSAGQAWHPS